MSEPEDRTEENEKDYCEDSEFVSNWDMSVRDELLVIIDQQGSIKGVVI